MSFYICDTRDVSVYSSLSSLLDMYEEKNPYKKRYEAESWKGRVRKWGFYNKEILTVLFISA